MDFLIPRRRFDPAIPELMDRPNGDIGVLRDDLKNLRIINRFFGGLGAVRTHIAPLFSKMPAGKTIEILDLATGSGDHPISLVRYAHAFGHKIRITAIERNALTLCIAKERTQQHPEIAVEHGDILSLPYPEKSFDIVLCSLAIHHFSREDGVRILENMKRLSRVGLIVNDLSRSWPAAWIAWAYTHATTRNPMTLHDSYVSVLRAYTLAELRAMALEADLPPFEIHRHPMFRLVLVAAH